MVQEDWVRWDIEEGEVSETFPMVVVGVIQGIVLGHGEFGYFDIGSFGIEAFA